MRTAVHALLIVFTYVVTARLGLLFNVVAGNVSLVWPPSGLALAALLLGGLRYTPALALAAFITTWSTGAPFSFALTTAIGNPLEAVTAVLLLRRAGFRCQLDSPPDVLWLAVHGALLSTMVSATVGVAGLCASDMVPWSVAGSVWWKWWLGDAMGVLLMTPVVCGVALWRSHRPSSAALAEWLGAMAGLLATSGLAHYHWWLPADSRLSLAFLPFPFLMWIALRLPAPAVALANLAAASMALAAVAIGSGPLVDLDLHTTLAQTWGYIAVLILSMLLLSATVEQLRASRQALADSLAERQELERRALEAERLQSIGRLAGGIAHDFNNVLTAMYGHLALARRALRRGQDVHEYLDEITQAADRSREVVQQLLGFARREISKPDIINLNALVQQTDKLLRRVLGEHIEIATDLAPDLGNVRADPGQLVRVLINLAANARDAMTDGGTLRIVTRNVVLGPGISADLSPGEYVELCVIDSGTGMSEQVLTHLFEPFFTTKEIGRGTGLGLATSYGIIKQNQGHISVRNGPDRGSIFTIHLPRHQGAGAAAPELRSAQPASGHETVLVVEDDDAVRGLVVATLRERGFLVLTAANGVEALALVEHATRPIDLLLTDVRMPRLGGVKLGEALAHLLPDIPVIYMTGYAEQELGISLPSARLLQKPFAPEDVIALVRRVLDEAEDRRNGARQGARAASGHQAGS